MKVLVVDVGGTSVKFLATGQKEPRMLIGRKRLRICGRISPLRAYEGSQTSRSQMARS